MTYADELAAALRQRSKDARAEAAATSRYHLIRLTARRYAVAEIAGVHHLPDHVMSLRLATKPLRHIDASAALARLRKTEPTVFSEATR